VRVGVTVSLNSGLGVILISGGLQKVKDEIRNNNSTQVVKFRYLKSFFLYKLLYYKTPFRGISYSKFFREDL